MEGKKSYQSWTISDEFGEAIKDEIPKKERDPNKTYGHAPGQGRKRMPARQALEGIFYVLRTGCQWKAVPPEYGSGSTTEPFKSGRQRVSLRKFGQRDWSSMMNWKGSAGNGKVWTAV